MRALPVWGVRPGLTLFALAAPRRILRMAEELSPQTRPRPAAVHIDAPPTVIFTGPLSARQLRGKVLAYTLLFGTPTRLLVSGMWMHRGSGAHVSLRAGKPHRVLAIDGGFLQVELSPTESTIVAPGDVQQSIYSLEPGDATECPGPKLFAE